MNKLWILVLVTLLSSTWTFQSVDSFRNDLIPSPSNRQGCIWSKMEETNSTSLSRGQKGNSPNPNRGFLLDCNLRTLNVDFWNYTFNKDQIEQTSRIEIKCNDKLFFESFLSSNQSLFQLVNLKQLEIRSCKIRKIPGRVFQSLGFLQILTLNSGNGEWSSSVGLEIESGSFEGLEKVETLDISGNNIWSLPDKNIFCPLRSIRNLNMSFNRLSDIEELSPGEGVSVCPLNVENLDLSFNSIRRLANNAFSRMKKCNALRLQNNLLEELEDFAFAQLDQMRLLNLSSNRLVALPPSIFRHNPALREINLSNNSISALSPQVFSVIKTLQSLDLSFNMLTSLTVKDNMFSRLDRLVILRLSQNQLSYVDGSIFKDLTRLQALYLDGNRIESISLSAFTSLSQLQILDLSRNRLSQIGNFFTNLFALRQLSLDHNKIRSMDDNALTNCSALQDLGIADNLLNEVPVALRAGLMQLTTLDIGENRISTVGNSSFQYMNQLYGLRIVGNRLVELPNGFCDSLQKLRVLNVAQNKINSISPSAFTFCPELRALRLDSNLLNELPPTLVSQLPNLLWLNVSQNQIRWADYSLLPGTLEWFDISFNSLSSLGGSESPSSHLQLRVLDASHNFLTSLDYTTITPSLETMRLNHNKLKTVAPDTFIRSTRLRRVELIGNQLETLPLSSLRFPAVPNGKPLPEFYLGGNSAFLCDCSMEWLTRVNQLTVLRTHPRIVDLDAIMCRSTFSRPNQLIPLVEMRPKDFLCPYKSHCFALCHCCDFDACDCEMTCPSGCNCYHDTAWSSNIVECSYANYTDVPARIPMDATEIYLDGNNLPTLKSHIFIGKKHVRRLFLNDSKIEFISNKTFNGLKTSLEVLRLDDNYLTELHGYEFADLNNLKELYLQQNLLRFIAKETFAHLQLLQTLRLDGNMLIDFNVWKLSGNGYLRDLRVSGNPWTCDCEFIIPFRTWVASKSSIVVDFTLANCQTVNTTHVIAGSSSSDHHYPEIDGHSNPTHVIANNKISKGSSSKLYPIQEQHPISSMCNHNPELNFNFDPMRAIESEIMTNHISAMAGGAEKVSIPHPTDREIQFNHVDSATHESMNTIWSLVLTLTALILLVVVIVVIFRKEIYYWIYTRISSNNSSGISNIFPSFLLSLLCCCCGETPGKKSRSSGDGDEADKLFDAYFIYGKKDEDILVQKIAPELESQGPPHFRLCLHYRDLCLNSDNPWNTDMILSACDASKRVVLVLSRTFLQSELTHPHFRQAIQSAINRHQKKLILILLPPFSEQNLSTIYPELKNSVQVKSSTLEWTDKNFWSKLKLILPTPCNINTTSRRRGSSLLISGNLQQHPPAPLIDLHTSSLLANAGGGGGSSNNSVTGTMSSYTINRLDFPYNSSHHQYHRNILPYQIPMSNTSTLNPPVPKHHIALTTPFFQNHHSQSQQNFSHYNGSQHSSQYYMGIGANNNVNLQNFIHIPGIPYNNAHQGPGGGGGGAVIYPMNTLPHNNHQQQQQHFSFNESFRRHLQQQQNHHQQTPVLQFVKQSSGGGGNNGSGTAYQPLEPNYSSSAISSSVEELDHVYSTLDSPLQSPNSANTTSTNVMNSSSSIISPNGGNNDSANKLGLSNKRSISSSNNASSSTPPSNTNSKEFSSQNQSFTSNCNNSGGNNINSNRSELPVGCRNGEGQSVTGTNGQMYFV